MTTVEGVSALRQRFYGILTGSAGFDWAGLAAFKTHVTLREALEIEATMLAASDARWEWQEWYGDHVRKHGKPPGTQASQSQLDELNVDAMREEVEMLKQAIAEDEQRLAVHRQAILANEPSPFTDADIDATHANIEALRANLPAVEAALVVALDESGEG